MSTMARVASTVVCQDVMSAAVSVGVARHGSACNVDDRDTMVLELGFVQMTLDRLSNLQMSYVSNGKLALLGFSVHAELHLVAYLSSTGSAEAARS